MQYFRLIENKPGRTSMGYGFGGARWNYHSVPMIYACNRSSMNFLELLAIKGAVVAKANWVLITFEVAGKQPHILSSDLPDDWTMRPYPTSTQEFGSQWAQGKRSVALIVPSCRLPLSSYPNEHNLLINPLHPDFRSTIKVANTEQVDFELNRWALL